MKARIDLIAHSLSNPLKLTETRYRELAPSTSGGGEHLPVFVLIRRHAGPHLRCYAGMIRARYPGDNIACHAPPPHQRILYPGNRSHKKNAFNKNGHWRIDTYTLQPAKYYKYQFPPVGYTTH